MFKKYFWEYKEENCEIFDFLITVAESYKKVWGKNKNFKAFWIWMYK